MKQSDDTAQFAGPPPPAANVLPAVNKVISQFMASQTRLTGEADLPHPTRRNPLWWTCQVLLRVVFTVWLRYRSRGSERIPLEGGGLFLINHQSFLDPLLAALPLSRPVSYLARDSLFTIPILGWILRRTYVMPINRESAGSASIRNAVRRMEHGLLVGIFPEGTRTRDGNVGEMKPGFVSLIRRVNVPVYPVGIAGAHEAFPRGAWFLRPRPVRVIFGEPIPPDQLRDLSQKGCEEQLVKLARDRIIACQQEADSWLRQKQETRPTEATRSAPLPENAPRN